MLIYKYGCIYEAQTCYADMLTGPCSTVEILLVLFHFFGADPAERSSLAQMLLQVILTVTSMIWYLCELQFQSDPFPLAAAVDVLSTTDRRSLVQSVIYDPPICDLSDMCTKIREKHATADAVLQDAGLMRVLRLWARHSIVENMQLERLLALFRRSCANKKNRASVQQIVSSGYLAQVRAKHMEAGGLDPTSTTRSMLLEAKAPIQALKTKKRNRGSAASFHFINEKQAVRKKFVGPLNRMDNYVERRDLGAEFKRLSHAEKQKYVDLDGESAAEPEGADEPGPSKEEMYHSRIGNKLWGLSDITQPFTADEVEKQACSLGTCQFSGRQTPHSRTEADQ